MSQPTETTVRPDASRVRTVRMYDDAWDLIGDRAPDHSKFIRDMTDAGLNCARCWRCSALVPISFGDLTGKSLAAWIFEAAKTVTAQHRDGHRHITIGNGNGNGNGGGSQPGEVSGAAKRKSGGVDSHVRTAATGPG